MKVQGAITKTQTLKGTISSRELLALVRATVHVPEDAKARFYVCAPGGYLHQGMQPVSPLVDVDDAHPLTFMIDWSLPVGKDEQG
jgi:hypothetical protein